MQCMHIYIFTILTLRRLEKILNKQNPVVVFKVITFVKDGLRAIHIFASVLY